MTVNLCIIYENKIYLVGLTALPLAREGVAGGFLAFPFAAFFGEDFAFFDGVLALGFAFDGVFLFDSS